MDFIGIGSLNLDFIVRSDNVSARLRRILDSSIGENPETLVDDASVQKDLDYLGTAITGHGVLGGSTFNVIRTIAEMNLGLRLGYVGVAGIPDGQGFLDFFADKQIDTTFVSPVENTAPGKCLAYIRPDKERRLKTGRGAEAHLVDCITRKALELGVQDGNILSGFRDYLASSRWLHITSFHDQATLEFFTKHIKAAKAKNPGLRLSFDPGYDYCEHGHPYVFDLARIADYLFLSEQELALLSSSAGASSRQRTPQTMAANLFSSLMTSTQIVILKRRSRTLFARLQQGDVEVSSYWHGGLTRFQIKDDVGAGDVFAGGFIGGCLTPVFEEYGRGPANIATTLVKARLKNGPDGFFQFGALTKAALVKRRARETLNWRDRSALFAPGIGLFLFGTLTGAAGSLLFKWLDKWG